MCFGYFSEAAVVRQKLIGLSAPGSVLAQKHFVGEGVKSERPLTQEGSVYQMTLQFVMQTSLSQYICYKRWHTVYNVYMRQIFFSILHCICMFINL